MRFPRRNRSCCRRNREAQLIERANHRQCAWPNASLTASCQTGIRHSASCCVGVRSYSLGLGEVTPKRKHMSLAGFMCFSGVNMIGRGERTCQPQADLNPPKAGKCAKGAQARQRRTSLLGGVLYPPLADSDSNSSSHLRP